MPDEVISNNLARGVRDNAEALRSSDTKEKDRATNALRIILTDAEEDMAFDARDDPPHDVGVVRGDVAMRLSHGMNRRGWTKRFFRTMMRLIQRGQIPERIAEIMMVRLKSTILVPA